MTVVEILFAACVLWVVGRSLIAIHHKTKERRTRRLLNELATTEKTDGQSIG